MRLRRIEHEVGQRRLVADQLHEVREGREHLAVDGDLAVGQLANLVDGAVEVLGDLRQRARVGVAV